LTGDNKPFPEQWTRDVNKDRFPRRLLPFLPLISLLLLTACYSSEFPPNGRAFSFPSADYIFVQDVRDRTPQQRRTVRGTLYLPKGQPPFPAVVFIHGGEGVSSTGAIYANILIDEGYAVMIVDSFVPRGAKKVIEKQSVVPAASMMADAYAALDLLALRSAIDPNRVAVMGTSKGATVALFAAYEDLATRLSQDGRRFRAHVAHYPWCGLLLKSPLTGAPVLINAGERDNMTPPALCEELAAYWAKTSPGTEVDLVVHPGVAHAFDHPMLNYLRTTADGEFPSGCQIVEESEGEFLETSTQARFTNYAVHDVLANCSTRVGSLFGSSDAMRLTRRILLSFLERTLKAPRTALDR